MKKALILTWDGYQDQEVIYPYYRLQEEYVVDVAAEKLGFFFGILGTKMEANVIVKDLGSNLRPEEYHILVLPGGVKALEKLRQQENALKFIAGFNALNRVISSTCHGAQLLISSKITLGKKISGYYSIKDDIVNSGATYVDAPFVIDGNIVSSPHYKHMASWMKETMDLARK